MYELPESLLVANPINRYLLNSPMLPQFVKDADGGLHVLCPERIAGQGQGAELAARSQRPVLRPMRLYWPKEAALDGTWKHPPMTKTQ